jgi:N-acyl homoserine lactone hydrolase
MLKDTRVGTPMDIPIPFLLIKHGKDWIAFDTGCNAQVAIDPITYWGEGIVKAYTPVMRPDQEFKIQIKKVFGLKPSDFKAVLSVTVTLIMPVPLTISRAQMFPSISES